MVTRIAPSWFLGQALKLHLCLEFIPIFNFQMTSDSNMVDTKVAVLNMPYKFIVEKLFTWCCLEAQVIHFKLNFLCQKLKFQSLMALEDAIAQILR